MLFAVSYGYLQYWPYEWITHNIGGLIFQNHLPSMVLLYHIGTLLQALLRFFLLLCLQETKKRR
jgi:hypothetical protein